MRSITVLLGWININNYNPYSSLPQPHVSRQEPNAEAISAQSWRAHELYMPAARPPNRTEHTQTPKSCGG